MKRFLTKNAIRLIIPILIITSCNKSYVGPTTSNSPQKDSVTNSLATGIWKITSFTQKTEDKTSKFSDIGFTFNSDGSLTATSKNGSETKGTWAFTPAITYYGSSSKAAIAFNMGTGNPLNLLTKTWNFISSSYSLLKINSPELLEDEHVQFSRQ